MKYKSPTLEEITTDNLVEHDRLLAQAPGSGAGNESEICPNCKGVGKVEKTNGWMLFMGKCKTCDGTGCVKEAKPQPNNRIDPTDCTK